MFSRGAPTGTPTRLPRWGPRPAPRRSLAGPHCLAPLAALAYLNASKDPVRNKCAISGVEAPGWQGVRSAHNGRM